MKRLLTIFSALIFGYGAVAAPISRQQALQAAMGFLGTQEVTISLPKATTLQTEDPELYAFNREDGGYVILSGDDAVVPVLGWSDEGRIDLDNLNPSAAWWLGIYKMQIGEMRSSGATMEGAAKKWQSLSADAAQTKRDAGSRRTAGTPVVEYATAKWDQESPYNEVCSTKVHKGVSTGCVATAAAIICRYFEWPESGKGTIPSYKTKTDNYTVPSVILGHSYDYSQMPLTNGAKTSWTSEQKTAVATLMFELGAMSYMDYSTYVSGTFTPNLVAGLAKYMHYNKQAVEEYRTGYSDAAWLALIKQQLKDCGPLLYGGTTSSSESHQFVFDGYDSQDYFHVNWGWGGDENGWFLLSSLGESYKFNEGQSVVTNLIPDKEDSSKYRDYLILSPYETYKGLSTEAKTFKKDSWFYCKVGDLYNGGSDNFTGKIYVAVYDKDGQWKENISSPIAIYNWPNLYQYYEQTGSENYYYWASISCKITGEIEEGDRLRVHYIGEHNEGYALMDEKEGTWEIVITEKEKYSAKQIAAGTSFSYNRTTRTLTLCCKYDVSGKFGPDTTFELKSNKPYEIDLSSYASGTWTLVLNGGEEDLSIPVKL